LIENSGLEGYLYYFPKPSILRNLQGEPTKKGKKLIPSKKIQNGTILYLIQVLFLEKYSIFASL